MVMRRGNNFVERGGAGAVAIRLHHRGKIVRRDGIIGIVFGNLPNIGHWVLQNVGRDKGRRKRKKPVSGRLPTHRSSSLPAQ